MYRNNEHYKDPTAGDALSKARKPQRGEIWRAARKNNSASTLVLVIATHSTICNVLVLEERAYDDYYALKLAPTNYKYYNPARYSWEMNDHFISRVCTLQESEFDKVLTNLGYTHKFGR
jgi:hypothetical protein